MEAVNNYSGALVQVGLEVAFAMHQVDRKYMLDNKKCELKDRHKWVVLNQIPCCHCKPNAQLQVQVENRACNVATGSLGCSGFFFLFQVQICERRSIEFRQRKI